MAAAMVKWATWLPVVAAGAAAAYAYTRRQGYRTAPHGSALADRDSDTRQKLGGPAGVHVEEAVTVNRPVADTAG